MTDPSTYAAVEGKQLGVDVETLHGAGYSSGDILWVFSANGGTQASTTDSTYTPYNGTQMEGTVRWDRLFNSNQDTVTAVWVNINASTDAIDIRLQNVSDGETAIEVGDLTATGEVELGPVSYTPTTTSAPVRFVPFFRNNDGTTEVNLNALTYSFGVTI